MLKYYIHCVHSRLVAFLIRLEPLQVRPENWNIDENLNQDRDHDALQVAWHNAKIVETLSLLAVQHVQ